MPIMIRDKSGEMPETDIFHLLIFPTLHSGEKTRKKLAPIFHLILAAGKWLTLQCILCSGAKLHFLLHVSHCILFHCGAKYIHCNKNIDLES